MTSPDDAPRPPDDAETPPLGQRFYDSPFVLLVLGLLVMLVSFTAWGLWEITSLPTAPLP